MHEIPPLELLNNIDLEVFTTPISHNYPEHSKPIDIKGIRVKKCMEHVKFDNLLAFMFKY